MSIAAKLFFSTDVEKQTLHRRIIPTDKQQEAQKERWNDLSDYLKEDLFEKTEYSIKSWLQGSYKFATQIRPSGPTEEFDIDLGIYFIWEGQPDDGKFNPIELKNITQDSLESYAQESEDEVKEVLTPPKNRCCRIIFSDNFHIDVPVYHLDENDDVRNLATEENEWENSDPKALFEWFSNECKEEQEGLQIRRMIRYIKMWSSLTFKEENRPSSIMITVLMIEAYKKASFETINDDDLFYACVNNILERIDQDRTVLNPVDGKEDINRLSDQDFQVFKEKIEALCDISKRALKSSTEMDSAVIWQEAFRHFFPLPEISEKDIKQGSKALSVIEFDPQVEVIAQPENNINRTYRDINKIGPIPRKCNIHFRIINNNLIPQRSKIEWTVRNEGEEAENKNDLGHYRGDKIEATENSAYKGTHYMDLVVKSYFGYPIGFRRIPVTVEGTPFPSRNPKYKPGYLKIRNKKR
ncbi:MAG: CBASS cGAMP synthase [Candidatus Paceibacterota bacterium]